MLTGNGETVLHVISAASIASRSLEICLDELWEAQGRG